MNIRNKDFRVEIESPVASWYQDLLPGKVKLMAKNEHYLGEEDYDYTLFGIAANNDNEMQVTILSTKTRKIVFQFNTEIAIKEISFTANGDEHSDVDVLILDQ